MAILEACSSDQLSLQNPILVFSGLQLLLPASCCTLLTRSNFAAAIRDQVRTVAIAAAGSVEVAALYFLGPQQAVLQGVPDLLKNPVTGLSLSLVFIAIGVLDSEQLRRQVRRRVRNRFGGRP